MPRRARTGFAAQRKEIVTIDRSAAGNRLIELLLPFPADHRAGDAAGAEELLADDPSLSAENIFTAAMTGDLETVRSLLARDPSLAVKKGGPKNWDPLLYLCFSRFLRTDPDRAGRMAAIVKLLLDAGADPNTFWREENDPTDNRESALYGAAGVANNVEIARLLLEAGGDPNDGETPYHACEHDGVPCAELLFAHGLDDTGRSVMLRHKIDYDDEPGIRKLLELGADPNNTSIWGKSALHQAVFRDRSRAVFEMLFDHGADPSIVNAEGKTAWALAARTGLRNAMAALRARGGATPLDAVDTFLAACAAGDGDTVERIRGESPGFVGTLSDRDRAVIVEMASAGNTRGVAAMLAAGVDVNTRGTVWNETAAHRAAMAGHLETVRLLVNAGADLTIRDRSYDSSPLGWAEHGGQKHVLEFLLEDPARIDLRDAMEFGPASTA